MKRVTSQLVYGVPPLSEVAAPPGAIPEVPTEIEEAPEFQSTFRQRPPPVVERCREAGPNDHPEQPADHVVRGKPKQGLYVWKVQGSQRAQGLPFRLRLSAFGDRSVEEVRDDATTQGAFTFQTRERDPSLNSRTIITQSFRVDPANPSAQLRGLFLTRILKDKQDGSQPAVFEPTTPVMYLPLPVQIGSRFESTGVDPRNPFALQTLSHSGFVKERIRVDACGDVVDGWLVEAEQVVAAGSTSSRRRYHYSVATQLGALIVFEHVESPCTSTVEGRCTPEPDLIYDTNIGQLEPDPLGSR